MAVKTYCMALGNDGNFGALVDGVDQTAANRTDGWTCGKVATSLYADFDAGTKLTTAAFTSFTKPAGLTLGTAANAFKTPAPLTGTFAATAWTLTFALRATVASSQAVTAIIRVYKSVNADGSGATELTTTGNNGGSSGALSTSVDKTCVITWSPGAITLNNEYLFVAVAIVINTSSGSNTGDVVFRTGQAAGGSRFVTPDFVASTPKSSTDANGTTTESASVVLPDAYANAITAHAPRAYYRLSNLVDYVAKNPNAAANLTAQTTQDNPTNASTFTLNGDTRFAQSFVTPASPGGSQALTSVRFNPWNSGAAIPDNLIAEIFSDNAGVPGTFLASVGTVAGSTLTGSAPPVDLPCSVPVSVGTTYWLVLRRSDITDVTTTYRLLVSNTTTAPNWALGKTSSNGGASWVNATSNWNLNGRFTYGRASAPPVGDQPSLLPAFPALKGTLFDLSYRLSVANDTDQAVGDVFSVEAWIKRRRATGDTYMGILSHPTGSYYLRINNTDRLELVRSNTAIVAASTVTIADTLAHHVVATKSGATVKLYIDGVDVTGTVSNSTMSDASATTGVVIGDEYSFLETFDGTMQELALYDIALTQAQVLAHYNLAVPSTPISASDNGTARESASRLLYPTQVLTDGPAAYWRMDEAAVPIQDISGSGFHMTGISGAFTQVAGLLVGEPSSPAIAFAGGAGTDQVNCPGNIFLYNTVTIEMLLRRSTLGVQQCICSQYGGGVSVEIMSDGTIALGRSFQGIVSQSSALKITDSAVHHLVVTRNGIGGAVIFYLDGVSETGAAGPQYSGDLTAIGASYAFFVGSEWGNRPFGGTLDELAVYPSVLPAARVTAHYSVATTAIQSGADANSATTESASVRVVTSDFDALSLPPEVQALVAKPAATDANGTLTESTSLATFNSVSSSDNNSAVTESTTPKAVLTTVEPTGAEVEAATIKVATTDTDALSLPPEQQTLTAALTSTEPTGAEIEAASVAVPVAATDVNAATTESVTARPFLADTDANGTTTESAIAVPQVTPVSGSDANGATTEAAAQTAVIPATDVNGALTEVVTVGARPTADANGAVTEATTQTAAVPSSDASGAVTEAVAPRLATADANGATTESALVSAPVSVTDANGVLTETAAPRALPAVTDANGAATEAQTQAAAIPSSDTASASDSASVLAIVRTTSVIELALSSISAPTDLSQAYIHVRARKANPADAGVLRVWLYEGATLRDGPYDITLTDTFATHERAIAAPPSIANWAGLSLRLQGISGAGLNLTPQVSRIDLASIPPAGTPVSGSDSGSGSDNQSLVVAVSATDSNGATTETQPQTVAIPTTDVNSAVTEAVAQRQAATDANAATTEAQTASAALAASDVQGATTETQGLGLIVTDVNGATTDTGALVAKPAAADSNAVTTEAQSVPVVTLAASDSNSVTTENQGASTGIPVATSDTNSATTEAQTPKAVLTAAENATAVEASAANTALAVTDANGTTTESVAPKLTVTDANGTTSEVVAQTYAVTVTDVNGAVTEAQVLAAPVAATDTNAATTESVAALARVVADSNSAAAEATAQSAALAVSDTDGVITEAVSTGAPILATDSNAVTTETQVRTVALLVADSNSTTSETQTQAAAILAADSGTSSQTQSLLMSGIVGASLALAYTVKSVRGVSDQLSYRVLTRMGTSRALPYALRSALGRSSAFSYLVRAAVARTLVQPYKLRAWLGVSRALPWTTRVTLARSCALTWQNLVRLGGSRVLPWATRQSAGKSSVQPYKLAAPATRQLVLPYALRARTTRSCTLPWTTRQFAARSCAFPYGVRLTAGRSSTFPYTLTSHLDVGCQLVYVISRRSGVSCRFEYELNQAGVRGKSLVFAYLVHLDVAGAGVLDPAENTTTVDMPASTMIDVLDNTSGFATPEHRVLDPLTLT